jgi:sterol desaturase/sphingolipid hydroxylase (fatty acid hydroxylase superfamily)
LESPPRPAAIIALMIPVTYVAMVLVERLGTGQRWTAQRGWQLTGIAGFAMLGLVNGLVSNLLHTLFGRVHLLDGPRLGTVGGTIVGYLVLSYGNAVLHRAYHRYGPLWRYVHQLHHSPARLDVAGVMYQTPFEAAANAVLFSAVTVFLLGLDPITSMLVAYVGAFYGMFQHFNIRTPTWLGFFIQRPESHCEHHRRDVHASNYSDLPIWDILWGSFLNPKTFHGELGFEPGASARWRDMLMGRDVNPPREQRVHRHVEQQRPGGESQQPVRYWMGGAPGDVDVLSTEAEEGHGEDDPRRGRLNQERTPIVAGTFHRPQQHDRHCEMEQRQAAHGQGDLGLEQVRRPASPGESVETVEELGPEERHGLPGQEARTLAAEAHDDEDVAVGTEPEEGRERIGVHVERKP